MSLLNQPIVLDNGSGIIKLGFAGQEQPLVYAPNILGRHKYSKVMTVSEIDGISDPILVGKTAQKHRGILKLSYPMKNGHISDWNDIELIWNQLLTKDLKVNDVSDHPILVTEIPFNNVKNREKLTSMIFESFNFPALNLSIPAVLSLYSSGRTTGVVLDSGDEATYVVPIYEGFSLNSSMKRIDIGGRDITKHVQFLLRKNGVQLLSSSEFEIVRQIKERYCRVSLDPAKDEREWSVYISTHLLYGSDTLGDADSGKLTRFKLPDGKMVEIGAEMFRGPEIMFNPVLIGSEANGVDSLLTNSINSIDIELRPQLYQSILLAGGSTMFQGFGNRLLSELKSSCPKGTKLKIFSPPERKYSAWVGGSILAGLSTFQKLCVTREQYMENPESVVEKFFLG
ncbi:Dynactin complex actin-related protein [Komagataella phaffii CBS 7435]|uniref:Actin-related protein of the dynactin complex n=2 Tax=Komagataella phaffii TaxID=460519 RepID=C4QWL1_KOMPG|nr:Actin-related protein of the dynactin complex [Komagataella phaffii GS115]AOA61642.1 GQ67_02843T0 [Komagataella phaffii]CAH2446349.1 Dynactin complex actin-related protein [Komagataella phaffii CBS 7435]AOA66359.1 GQ68_02404T0 [Komagataella phaffii GS115]CAY67634.1 Actin-related protein of the dynactin complex [Komagataella phaffii GS115]CCA36726.1 Dynactin complex actin-related protein [Komagataella phaffii CBS 7435]